MTPSEKVILDGLHAEMAAVPASLGQNAAIRSLRRIRDGYVPAPRRSPGLGMGTQFRAILDAIVVYHRDRVMGRPLVEVSPVPEADEPDPSPPEPAPEPEISPVEADQASPGVSQPSEEDT